MKSRRVLLALTTIALASPAVALTDEEVFRDFRLNLINPGARALGLGGAFISVADDATAAQTNPAGLTNLLRPEVFAELRYVDNGGSSRTVRETLPAGIDTFVATGIDREDFASPSFLSYVHPVGRFTLGVSRQDVLHNDHATLNSFAFTFPGTPGAFLVQGSGAIDVRVTSYNASVGFRVNDRWRLGGSLGYSRLDVESSVANFIVDTQGSVAGRPILEPTLDLRTGIDDDDDSFGLNLGTTFRVSDSLSIGAVYRRAPKFSVTEVIDPQGGDLDGDGFPDHGIDSLQKRQIFGCAPTTPCAFQNEFNLPDSYGVSLSWQIRDNITLTEDIERIEYSDQLRGYRAGVNVLTAPDSRFVAEDAWEARLGVEYILVRPIPVAFRAGVYSEHDSSIRAADTGTNAFATPASFPGRDAKVHATVGVGTVWKQGQYRLDAAAALGSDQNQFLLSFIFRGK